MDKKKVIFVRATLALLLLVVVVVYALAYLTKQELTPTTLPAGASSSRSESADPDLSYEDLARQTVEALGSGDIEKVESLFVSKEDFLSLVSGENGSTLYEARYKSFVDTLPALASRAKGMLFVEIDMDNTSKPRMITPEMTAKQPTPLLKSILTVGTVYVTTTIDGTQHNLSIGEMVKIGDSWRLIGNLAFNEGRPVFVISP